MKKTKAIQTPHDAIFKQFLAEPATIKDFIELHLPQELQAICSLNTLRLLPGSFIEDNLRPYYSDVLYSLQTTEGEGYLHILIEHQSTPDKHMAFRLMRYSIAAMQQHLKIGHDRLPLVIPVLFYAGKRSPYPYSLNWLEDFENPTLAGKIYGGNFILVDVTAIPDEEIMQHRSMAALTLLQKHIHQRELAAFSDKLAATLLTDFLSSEQLKLLINYIVQAGETEEAERLIRELAEKVPQHGEELMTIAQQLEQKGFEKGIEQGIEQGYKEKAMQIARLLLQKGVSQTIISETTGISTDELIPLQQ